MVIIYLCLMSWIEKLELYEEKKKIKTILLNSVVIFIICFLFLFIYQAYEEYDYYSIYSKEELAEFFSMKDTLVWILDRSLHWSIMQMIIFVPILIILEKTKIKNIFKIIITLVLTFIISFLYIISNFTYTF